MGTLFGDAIEVLIVIAVGGMLGAAILRLRRGQLRVPRCSACDRPASRAYLRCPYCGAARDEGAR